MQGLENNSYSGTCLHPRICIYTHAQGRLKLLYPSPLILLQRGVVMDCPPPLILLQRGVVMDCPPPCPFKSTYAFVHLLNLCNVALTSSSIVRYFHLTVIVFLKIQL